MKTSATNFLKSVFRCVGLFMTLACPAQEKVKDSSHLYAQGQATIPTMTVNVHRQHMRHALEAARANPRYPFGAAIIRASNGEVMATGVNHSAKNPILHGEMDCINNYVRKHGNRDWKDMILYTTGEPCSMCMSALIWAGVGGVVYASNIDGIRNAGIGQIGLTARQVLESSPFEKFLLLGGILAEEADQLFLNRQR